MLLLSSAGCATAMLGGKSGTRFEAPIADVSKAAYDTLEAENLPVTNKYDSASLVKIYSRYPNGTPIRIVLRQTAPGYTDTNVNVGTFGEDYRAYDLLKMIDSRLGK